MSGLLLRFFFLFVLFVYFFCHCALQFPVYMRTVEFVCTSINSLLKRCRIHHFLVSWAAGSLLIALLLLLVGINPCLPAQGQSALSSINPRGLQDLERFCSREFWKAAMGHSWPWGWGRSVLLVSVASAPLPFPGLLGSLLRSWTKSAASLTSV